MRLRDGAAGAALGGLLALSAVGAALAQPATADMPQTTEGGSTYTLPKAWSAQRRGPVTLVQAPETDARVAIVEVGPAADAKAAADRAFALYAADRRHPFKLAAPRPARDGWDEQQTIAYETSANEKLVLAALAARKGAAWTVVIVDSSEASAEKRGAAFSLLTSSLRPAGYARESFAGRTPHRLDAARVETLKAFVVQAMKDLDVPGASLALVDHGKVVFEGGLGVRELGRPQPVTAHTRFMIASNTKGMSTLLLARLVDQGRLRWDQRVVEVYPTFRLGSAETTSKVLIRQLVCACTGLPRKDYDWIFNTRRSTPATTTFTQLAATEPTSGFGEVFQYNNLMASAAGYIGGRLVHPDGELGSAFDRAMQELVFAPLGMTETTFDFANALAADHASPHGLGLDARPGVVDMAFNYSILPYRPAGGAWSSAHDMIRYVQDEITPGVGLDGRRVASEVNVLARRQPNVPTGEDGFYGMGLEGDSSWGVPVVHHGGSMAGYKSDWVVVPEAQVGAVLLTNSDEGRQMLRPFMRRLLEVLYDGKPEALADTAAAGARIRAQLLKERERLAIPPAAPALAALADRYTSAELGELKVRRAASATTFDFTAFKSRVASRRNDDGTTSFVTIDPGSLGFEFVVADRQGRRALVLRDGQHEYVYLADR